jgi:uncharacterized protein YbjT (DUF2867 family)
VPSGAVASAITFGSRRPLNADHVLPQSYIREQHAIYLAAGDGKTSFISVEDIAVAVTAALKQSLTGKEFDLTGPTALDHAEIAKIISKATGSTVVYHSLTEEQMLEGARSQGMPEPVVVYLGMLYSIVRAGFAAGISDDFRNDHRQKTYSLRDFRAVRVGCIQTSSN